MRNKINVGSGNNYRRFSAADTEALKRLAAIDSLLEAVSSDQKLSKIETLIDELSEKLREIERQNHADDSMFNGFGYANNDDVELNATNKVIIAFRPCDCKQIENNQIEHFYCRTIGSKCFGRSSQALLSCFSGTVHSIGRRQSFGNNKLCLLATRSTQIVR